MTGKKCPYCGSEMDRGELKSRGGVYFLPDGEKRPRLYTEEEMKKRNAVYLPPHMTGDPAEYPTAYLCKACSLIMIDY